jgi:hypothetical protein
MPRMNELHFAPATILIAMHEVQPFYRLERSGPHWLNSSHKITQRQNFFCATIQTSLYHRMSKYHV